MKPKEIYLGPDWKGPPTQQSMPVGEYTTADQARGWGIPEDQLTPENVSGKPCDDATEPVE